MHSFLAQTNAGGLARPGFWDGLLHDWHALGWLALMQVAFILAAWLVGRLLVPRREMNNFGQYEPLEGAGLGKAVLLYFGYLVLGVVTFLCLRFANTEAKLAFLSLFSNPLQLSGKWIAIFAALVPLAAALKIVLPMAIFQVRFLRAIMLLLLIAILLAGAGWGLDRLLGRPVEQRVAMVQEWAAGRSGHGLLKTIAGEAKEEVAFAAVERIAANPAKPIPERKEAVKAMYSQLEQIRAALPPDDKAALAGYESKMARYKAQLKKLQDEIAAHPDSGE